MIIVFQLFFLLIFTLIKTILSTQCPTEHYRCVCRLHTKGGMKEQTLTCSSLYALPALNDTSIVSAQWDLIVQESNDVGIIPPKTFSGVKRHDVRVWRCRRLQTVENHSFKDAKIDRLKISGFRSASIDKIESEAFSGLEPLSVSRAGCEWADINTEDGGFGSELSCTTSLSLTNVRSMHITDRSCVTLVHLQDLHLNVQDLKIDDGALSNLYGLEQLRIINANGFRPSRVTFKGLSLLRVLYLKGLGLDSLPDDVFDETPNLQVVILSRNSLTSMPQALAGLHQLHHLNLNKNKIRGGGWKDGRRVGDNLWPKMQRFVAKDNEMNSIPIWLKQLKNVEEVSLSGNSVLCDCDLLWLRDWPPFLRQGVFGGLGATCDTENWKTCSKVCPFNCDLRDCVNGLKKEHCALGVQSLKQNDQQSSNFGAGKYGNTSQSSTVNGTLNNSYNLCGTMLTFVSVCLLRFYFALTL